MQTCVENLKSVPELRRGDELEVVIEKFADRGKSLARLDGFIVFVPYTAPGDRVRIRIQRVKKQYAEAIPLEILEPSPLRTQPRCRYFGTCGGCKWQHVPYDVQLSIKRDTVEQAFVHQAGFSKLTIPPTLPSPDVYHYRNKMEFTFSHRRWLAPWEIAEGKPLDRSFALGLHVPGFFDRVLDIHECYLPPPKTVHLLNNIRSFVKKQGWEPWHIRHHTGYARHLIIRTPVYTSEIMVNIVTAREDPQRMEHLAAFLQTHHPEITTLVNTINRSPGQTAFGESFSVIYGPGVIHERLHGLTFEIAPNAFFQPNTRGAEQLYEVARTFAHLQPSDRVYDLYCGAGTISLYLARYVAEVIGVELVEEAVANARRNAALNGITNATFVAGDLLHLFTPDWIAQHGKPDVLIVDPPRGGMHKKVVQQIARLRPERMVYVSCNPMTQARDIAMLRDIYTIEAIQPVDMFPHTHHVENVVGLRLKHTP